MLTHIGSKSLKLRFESNKSKVKFFRYEGETQKIEVIHNILLLDLSGSMSYHIEQMIREVKDILMRLKGFVSIICYSGHNDSYILFKSVECNETSYKMNQVYEKLDDIEVIGLTIMSEPLQKSLTIQKELSNIVDLTNVILFTDGCIVTYDVEKEENHCFDMVKCLNEAGCIVSTIGFGQYYDKTFLHRISSQGYHCHIDDILEYNTVVNRIIENSKTKNNGITISQEHCKMINVTTGQSGYSIKMYPGNVLAVLEDNFEGTYEQKFENDLNHIIDSLYYSLAKIYLVNDDIDGYETTVKSLIGDIELYKKTKNSYSFIEKGKALSILDECIVNENKRFQKGRKFIIDNDDNEFSILEVIMKIMNDENSRLYWKRDYQYKRTGLKTENVDNDITFEINKDKKFFDIIDCSISSEKLNISVLVNYDGIAKSVKECVSMKAKSPRNYNIICNGNLNTRYLYARLSDEIIKELTDKKVRIIMDENNICIIDLKGLKTANKRISNSISKEELISTMLRLKENKVKQTVINRALKGLLEDDSKLNYCDGLSEIDIKVREILNIDEKGNLRTKVKKSTEKFEVYPATFMTWDVKIDSKKSEKEYQDELKESIYDKFDKKTQIILLKKFLEYFRKEIRKDMFIINCIRIANAMVGTPIFIFDSVTEKSKIANDKIMNQNMVVGGKVEVYTKIFDDTIFTQKKWCQLLKCS